MSEVNATPQGTQGEPEEITIGRKLFPEQFEPPVEATKLKGNAQVEGAVIEPPEVEPAPVEATPPAANDYLDIEAIKGKKVKLKVDGQEVDVPAEELIKNHQTWQHLSRVGQTIGAERKAIREEISRLEQLRQSQVTPQEPQNEWEGIIAPLVKPVVSEVVALKSQLKALSESITPLVTQTNVEKLDAALKAEGLTDFKEYIPKIQEYVYNNVPQEQWESLDNPYAFSNMYRQMKLRDMMKTPSSPAGTTSPSTNKERVVARPPVVESSNASTNVSSTSTLETQLRAATNKAQATSSSWDWAEVFRLRDEIAATK